MAYKFQRGALITSGTIEVQTGDAEISVSKHDGEKVVELTYQGVVSGSGAASFGSIGQLDTDLAVSHGGTGASSAAAASATVRHSSCNF